MNPAAPLRLPGADSIWGLAVAPIAWSAHFLWCYVVNAVLCARLVGAEEVAGLALIQWNVVAATAVMGAVLLWSVLTALGRMRDPTLDEPDEERSASTEGALRLFLAQSTFAIGVVSLVAMAWVAMPALFFQTCR